MGIVKSARNVFKVHDLNQLIDTDQLIDENTVVIMMDETPRKWYWNILMIFAFTISGGDL